MNISHSIIILFVLSLLLGQQNITAQNVIDNEVLSSDNDDEGNSKDKVIAMLRVIAMLTMYLILMNFRQNH